jgi:ParB/RepB/Spo0J family partition protein
MTTTTSPVARDIPVDQIRPFIRRARAKEGFEQMKASMREVGLKMPIQVRDLGRKDEEGHRYELICGEGRTTAAQQLKWEKIPALIVDAKPEEIAGRFLAENLLRKAQPWAEKGRTVQAIVRGGKTLQQAAKSLHISPNLASRYLRMVDRTAPELKEEVEALPVNDAEVLTTLPPEGQRIVIEVVKETGQSVAAITAKAKKAAPKDGWTKAALHKALRADDDTLRRQRDTLKRLRLHHALGPVNVRTLLKLPAFRKACQAAKLNLDRIEANA